MTEVTLDIPAVPLITARFNGDAGELSIDGVREEFTAQSTEHLREEILDRVTAVAADLGRPVQMVTEDDEGQWLLVVHPDGQIGEEERLGFEPAPADDDEHLAHAHRHGTEERHGSEERSMSDERPGDDQRREDDERREDERQRDDERHRDDNGERDAIDGDRLPRPAAAGTATGNFDSLFSISSRNISVDVTAADEAGFVSLLPLDHEPDEDLDGIDDLSYARAHFVGVHPEPEAPAAVDADNAVAETAEPVRDDEPERVGHTGADHDEDASLATLAAGPDAEYLVDADPADEGKAHEPVPASAAEPVPASTAEPVPASTADQHIPTRRAPALQLDSEPAPSASSGRASFLAEERAPDRATKGWRGFLARVGLPVQASPKELQERNEIHAVSQHWPGPRTIAIVNGKGGANKTPTTALLAAVFARNGGSGVLAWDNNETRGTLGWRTEQGLHDATVQTLLPNVDHLLSAGAQSSDLSHFVHHQTGDKYDVLRSNPTMLATQQRITTQDFDNLHSVAAKYFRLIFVDSGNDESAERWLRMIDHTDQLVIATTALGEHAEAGALLLEALAARDERSARLASQSVVIVSQSEKTGTISDARRVAEGFEPLARRAVSIPYDPAMHGGRLEFTALAAPTRRAWLHAAAAVAEGL